MLFYFWDSVTGDYSAANLSTPSNPRNWEFSPWQFLYHSIDYGDYGYNEEYYLRLLNLRTGEDLDITPPPPAP